MKYAFNYCLQTDFEQEIRFDGRCTQCKKDQSVFVPKEGLKKWRKGELIQNCFPKMSLDDREFLISGICGPCYDKIFEEME